MEETEEVEYSELTDRIIGAAMKVHSTIGPGVLESVYRTCMAHELKKLGLRVSCEIVLPVLYDGLSLDSGFRIDLLVEDTIVVELKCVDTLLRSTKHSCLHIYGCPTNQLDCF